MTAVAAVDIGATSGRVLLVEPSADGPTITELTRFRHDPVQRNGRWVWPIETLLEHVREGLALASERGARSCGIDTWAVDYCVLRGKEQVGDVVSYRDPGHAAGVATVTSAISWPDLYSITGVQFLPFNTIYQIAADSPQRLRDGSILLMIPDLLTYLLTGTIATDVTNASTTALVNPRTRDWSPAVLAALGIPDGCVIAPDEPGAVRGHVPDLPGGPLPVIGVATHDTASAFVGAPIQDRRDCLVISLGTWALVGAELLVANPSDAASNLNLTHELGYERTVRLLRNVSGMWLFEECRRSWAAEDGEEADVLDLLLQAAVAPAHAAIFDVDAAELASPGQTPSTIRAHLVGEWDGSRGSVVRTILESLVARLAQRCREIETYLGGSRSTIHVVGGASRNALLMQWLADVTGKKVVAGPAEATALGNAAVQWISLGVITDLAEARRLIASMPEIRNYYPRGNRNDWAEYAARLEA